MNTLQISSFRDKSNNRFLSLEPAEGNNFKHQEVRVSIFNKNVKKYLTGKESWHGEEHFFNSCSEPNPEKVFFGPPDVLDTIVENTQLRISAGGLTWEGTLPKFKNWEEDTIPAEKFWIGGQMPKTAHQLSGDNSSHTEPGDENNPSESTDEPEKNSAGQASIKRGMFSIAIGIFLLAGLLYFLFDINSSQCTSSSAESTTILLIDGTDTVPDKYKQQIGNLCFNKFVETVPMNGLLELRMIRENKPEGEIFFSKCNLGEKNWRSSYYVALENAMNMELTPSESHKKPLLETIKAIAQEHFTEYEKPKKFVILSDMIENTPAFSHFDGFPFQDRFDESEAKKNFQTKLRNAEIEICLIGRQDSQLNAYNLLDFWRSWITENGGIMNR